MFESIQSLDEFLETGGYVLYGIFFLTIVLWSFLLERYWFFYLVYPKHMISWMSEWENREDKNSWCARKIKEAIISRSELQLEQFITLIKTVIALGPLFGLLGTVSGMIEVFDMMSITGNNDPRIMASGISRAIITTMAGLFVALSGVYPVMHLSQQIKTKTSYLIDSLRFQG